MIHVKRMVALRTTQDFSMQHITSRGCRLDPLELSRLPAASSCAQEGRILQTTSPSPSLHSWPLPALQWRWVQTLGGQPLLMFPRIHVTPLVPRRYTLLSSPHLLPHKSSSLCPLTPAIPYTTSTCSCWVFLFFFCFVFKCTLAALLPPPPSSPFSALLQPNIRPE